MYVVIWFQNFISQFYMKYILSYISIFNNYPQLNWLMIVQYKEIFLRQYIFHIKLWNKILKPNDNIHFRQNICSGSPDKKREKNKKRSHKNQILINFVKFVNLNVIKCWSKSGTHVQNRLILQTCHWLVVCKLTRYGMLLV
jgi:hypothetical protein